MIEGQTGTSEISGAKVFELKDTYGFPEDLTDLILREKGFTYNHSEFKEKLAEQKARGKEASASKSDDWTILMDDAVEEFVGYDRLSANVKLTRYRKVTSKKDGEMFQLVFNLTPFYPEGGGQVGDKGYVESPDGGVVYILDTKKENNLIIHFTKNLPKDLTATFKAVVDERQRYRTECNHTATHLLHQGLREILGTHVEQKGSAVHSKYLRFDFSHFSKVTAEELQEVEDFVNARIAGRLAFQENRAVPMDEAIAEGAMALFGEKYGDAVRTVRFGQSIELCAGTHVNNTADLWHFKIKSEGAVASGIRRIEAITYDAVRDYYADNDKAFSKVKLLLNNTKNPAEAIEKMQTENNELKKEIEQLLKDKAKNIKSELKNEVTQVNGANYLAKELDLDASGLKDLAFELGGEIDNLFILFASRAGGKALLTCYIDKDLAKAKDLNAGTIVRALGKHIQGGGGGQPFFATAGGKNPDGIAKALDEVKHYLQ